MSDYVIRHAFNLQYYAPKWWERLVLSYCDFHVHEQNGVIVTYKYFYHRLYIHQIRKVTYLLKEAPNGGVNKPWTN